MWLVAIGVALVYLRYSDEKWKIAKSGTQIVTSGNPCFCSCTSHRNAPKISHPAFIQSYGKCFLVVQRKLGKTVSTPCYCAKTNSMFPHRPVSTTSLRFQALILVAYHLVTHIKLIYMIGTITCTIVICWKLHFGKVEAFCRMLLRLASSSSLLSRFRGTC